MRQHILFCGWTILQNYTHAQILVSQLLFCSNTATYQWLSTNIEKNELNKLQQQQKPGKKLALILLMHYNSPDTSKKFYLNWENNVEVTLCSTGNDKNSIRTLLAKIYTRISEHIASYVIVLSSTSRIATRVKFKWKVFCMNYCTETVRNNKWKLCKIVTEVVVVGLHIKLLSITRKPKCKKVKNLYITEKKKGRERKGIKVT